MTVDDSMESMPVNGYRTRLTNYCTGIPYYCPSDTYLQPHAACVVLCGRFWNAQQIVASKKVNGCAKLSRFFIGQRPPSDSRCLPAVHLLRIFGQLGSDALQLSLPRVRFHVVLQMRNIFIRTQSSSAYSIAEALRQEERTSTVQQN